MMQTFHLKQLVKSPIHENSILDKMYSNIQNWYKEAEILPPIGKSDHKCVLLEPKHLHALKQSNSPNPMLQQEKQKQIP